MTADQAPEQPRPAKRVTALGPALVDDAVPMSPQVRTPVRNTPLLIRTVAGVGAAMWGAKLVGAPMGLWALCAWLFGFAFLVAARPWASHIRALFGRAGAGKDRPPLPEPTSDRALVRRAKPFRRVWRWSKGAWLSTGFAVSWAVKTLAEGHPDPMLWGLSLVGVVTSTALMAPGVRSWFGRPRLRLRTPPHVGEDLNAELIFPRPVTKYRELLVTLRLVVEDSGVDLVDGEKFDRWHKTVQFGPAVLAAHKSRGVGLRMRIDPDERDPFIFTSWAGRPASYYELDVQAESARHRRGRVRRWTFEIPVWPRKRKPPRLVKSVDTVREVRIGECPRCDALPLDEAHRCGHCGGELLDEASVDNMAVTRLRLEGRHDLMKLVAEQGRKSIGCPGCGTRMAEVVIKGEAVDLCRGCGSLWLDGGEYLRIRQRAEKMAMVDDQFEGVDRG